VFMVGFAATPVIYGPLSDRYGRKPVLTVAVALFTAGSVAATFAPSIGLLLAARFAEGAGAGGGTALAFALVRDSFEGTEGRNKLSHVQMVMGIAPMIAPTIGAGLLVFGWRSIYAVLTLGGAALLFAILFSLRETHTNRAAQGSLFGQVVSGYGTLLRHRAACGYALLYAAAFGVQFSFISASPLVFMTHFGLSAPVYGLVFAAGSAGIMGGAFSNPHLARLGVTANGALVGGLAAFLLSSLAMLALLLTGTANAWNLAALLVISAYAYGVTAPNASHGTMQALPEIAGIAGAVLATLQMSAAVLASAIVAMSYSTFGVAAMVVPMLAFGVVSNVLYFGMIRPARIHA